MTPIIIVKRPVKLSADHVAQNRERVLDAALGLFRTRGFDRVSVSDLMREAGLTHGGFYNHFTSKGDLAAQACARAFAAAFEALREADAKPARAGRVGGLRGFIARYLSRSWRDADGAHCPMVAFAADAARDPQTAGDQFAAGTRAYVDQVAALLTGSEAERRREALFVVAILTGALTLARGVREADRALSDALLEAAREELLARLSENKGE